MSTCPARSDGDPAFVAHRLRRKGVSRREILKYTLAGAGLTALGPWAGRIPVAKGAPLGNRIYVLINLDGGADMLNAVIPATVTPYFTRRPNIAVQNAVSLPLTGGPNTATYRLHPEFDQVKTMWDAGDVAFVQRVGYPSENLSHFSSQDIYSYAVRNSFAAAGISQSGWIARFASLYAPTPMGAVALGMGRPTSFVGGTSTPLQVSSLSGFKFNSDSGSTGIVNNDALRKTTIKSLLAAASTAGTPGGVRDALDQAHQLSSQIQTAVASYAGTATYQNRSISQRLKDVAILVQAGFETRIFYTGIGGFDTHSAQGAQTGTQASLFTQLDDAIGSFATDMKAMGQWNNTVICLFTEFGRRSYENGSVGTDHGAAYSMILVGGGVNGGTYGPDLVDADLNGEYPLYAVDFRDVHREVLNDHLLVNPAPVFPETQPLNTVLGVA